jgi:predicted dehydrogenase
VLFIGLGGIGQRHLRNIKSIFGDDVHISAYRERGLDFVLNDQLIVEESLALKEVFGLEVYDSLDLALSQRPDVVFVTNPTSKHMGIALKAATVGCDLFIEKPLSHDYDGIERLNQIINNKKLVVMIGYQNRFHPCLKKAKDLLDKKSIGNVIAVNVEIGESLPSWHKYEDYRQMYASRKDLGGGVVLSQIHELDYISWFFGLPKKVFAIGGKLSDLEIDVEDVASVLMEYEVNNQRIPVHIHEDYLQMPPARTCKIIGTKGKISFDLFNATLQVHGYTGELLEELDYGDFVRNDMFIEELKYFFKCVEERTTPISSINEAENSLRMAFAIKESISGGNVIIF